MWLKCLSVHVVEMLIRRLSVAAQRLHTSQDIPELFDLHLDSVIGLGQLFGQQFGQTRVKRRKGRYLASCG